MELRISLGVSVLSLSIHTRLSGLAVIFLLCSTFFHRLAILLSTSLADSLEDWTELTLEVLPWREPREANVTVFALSLLCKLWFEAEFLIVGFVFLGGGLSPLPLFFRGGLRLSCGSLDGDVLFAAGLGVVLAYRDTTGFLSGTGKSLAGTELSSLVNVPCLSRGSGLPATKGMATVFCGAVLDGDLVRVFLGDVLALGGLEAVGGLLDALALV